MAHRTGSGNPIIGVDISPYMLREAGAEALPFADNSFDVSMSFMVIQAVDADRMLGEMVRVTTSGGRIAVLANGNDEPYIINLPLRAELKDKAEAPRGAAAHPQGCADASLYRRFHQVGLTGVRKFPQLATHVDLPRLRFLEGDILSAFNAAEMEEWWTAVSEAEAEGTFFIAEPFHYAVGTKPG